MLDNHILAESVIGPGRVARLLVVWPLNVGTKYNAGAPLFAPFAKGGHDAARSAGFDFVENPMAQTASYPPLHKTQGRGTHSHDGVGALKGRATRPLRL